MPVPFGTDEPGGDRRRPIDVEPAIGQDARGAGCDRAAPELAVVVLADAEDRPAGSGRALDLGAAVVAACGQVDEDAIDVGQRRLERGARRDRNGLGAGRADGPDEAGRPDEVVGQDQDARRSAPGHALSR